MADKKVIAVLGATGAQGGGLVRAILADPSGGFAARAITRKTDSDKAKALAAQGVEVVAADLDDEKSLEKAFAGAYGIYAVTNFWEHFSGEKEYAQAVNIAKAAKAAGAQHVIWSTFEDTRKWVPLSDNRMPTLQGKYKVAHFDAKAEANEQFKALGVPTTFLLTTFYWENLIYFGMGPKKGPDGKYAMTYPMGSAKLAGIAAEDIGKAAYAIFKKGKEFIGKTVGIAGEHLTIDQMATIAGKALGISIGYNKVTADTFRSFGFPGADDIGNMFQIYDEFEKPFAAMRSVEATRALVPGLTTFEAWMAANKGRIPLE
jgi:uncharacterized protein YbjT (DUF2867 family)